MGIGLGLEREDERDVQAEVMAAARSNAGDEPDAQISGPLILAAECAPVIPGVRSLHPLGIWQSMMINGSRFGGCKV